MNVSLQIDPNELVHPDGFGSVRLTLTLEQYAKLKCY